MANFNDFKEAVAKQMQHMFKQQHLFTVDADRDEIWEVYLKSFPKGTNLVYKERTEHDCSCCKQFIRDAGGMVYFKENGEMVSIWDVNVGFPYDFVALKMSNYVKTKPIKSIYLHYVKTLGTDSNKQMGEDGRVITWKHFYARLPKELVVNKDQLGYISSNLSSGKDVFKRSLEEISIGTIETVLELILQNSLYRGEEHKGLVTSFLRLKQAYDKLTNERQKEVFCWVQAVKSGAIARIKNSVIGTLLMDIEAGKDLDIAVSLFEAKVAPSNYKRPTAVITKGMIEKAQKEVEQLGLANSLKRRPATEGDIKVNDILFVNRTPVNVMNGGNIFNAMKSDVKVDLKKLKKVEEVTLDKFVTDIVPSATSIEVLLENRQISNLMALVAPACPDSPPILKWGNGFSWVYNGDVADSIKERVKRAGGLVDAVLRCSLSWFNTDDLDIRAREPKGNLISFSCKINPSTTGQLDVDMNVSNPVRGAVENITWTNKAKMQEGVYEVSVHNFKKRETIDVGFVVEIEYEGNLYTFSYTKAVKHNEEVKVAKFNFSRETGITFIESLPEDSISKNVWGLDTQKFHNVKLLMNSPNYWGSNSVGNKHLFFILEGCHNPDSSRGFYNEFLREDLTKHRKVFEVLASKTKVPASENQLCGLGFSSTKKDHFYCKVSGAFTRTIKVNVI